MASGAVIGLQMLLRLPCIWVLFWGCTYIKDYGICDALQGTRKGGASVPSLLYSGGFQKMRVFFLLFSSFFEVCIIQILPKPYRFEYVGVYVWGLPFVGTPTSGNPAATC